MTPGTDFDIGPLTWVKDEIAQALAQAREAIVAYADNPLDTAKLKFCKTHLHQAHGALEIVGLEGVTRLTEECENLLDAVEDGTVPIGPEVVRVAGEAFEALTAYLDELVEGMPHQPLRLFPSYRAVMAARGAERILESDLFFPDLSRRPPRRETAEIPADMRVYVAAQRRRFQSGLLRWLRDAADNAALREMTESVRAIERTQAMAQHRAFWWVTIAFTEALVAVGAQAGLEAKRLCARIDLQMKRLMEGSQNVAEKLLRDALYFVARSRVQSAQVQDVRRVYELDRALPGQGVRRDLRPLDADLRSLREAVVSAKEKWNRFASGQAHELAGFGGHAERLKERSGALGDADFSILASAIASVAEWAAANPGKVDEAIAMETATALLLAENALDNFARPSSEFPQQVMAMGARLRASLAGLPAEVPPPLLDEMARRAQERLVMAQVVAEIRSNLSAIESALDGFFRDSGRRAELTALEPQSRQIEGALAILGADRAVAALAGCRAEIARFAGPDYVPDTADFEAIARTLSALGFFVDALQHGPQDFETFLEPIASRRPRAAGDETTPLERAEMTVDFLLDGEDAGGMPTMATVEDELAAQRRDAQALFTAWRDKPGDSVIAAELKANLASIQQDANLVDEPALQQSAERALELLDSGAGAGAADIEAAMAGVAPQAREEALPGPSPEVQALAQSSDEVVDAELLAIFLEEAAEVLANVRSELVQAGAEPTNSGVLVTIRRGFHTLKGSGRMVGLVRLGEAAWAVEQVMNQWLREERPANADLLAMIGAAHDVFSAWISGLAGSSGAAVDGAPLIRACERMAAGEGFKLQPPEGEVASPGAPAESGERSIVIGDLRLSPGLYGIFVDEAGVHLQVMRRELESLAVDAQPPRDELVRAAHTLAGIAGTVNFRRLHELARALERAALVARTAGIVPDGDDVATLDAAVEGIGELVEAVRDLREPPEIEPIEARLERLRADWLAVSGEIDPALLHVEPPPLDQEPEPPAPDTAFAEAAFAGGEATSVDLDLSEAFSSGAGDSDLAEAAAATGGVLDFDFDEGAAPEMPTGGESLAAPPGDGGVEGTARAPETGMRDARDDHAEAVASTGGGLDIDFDEGAPAGAAPGMPPGGDSLAALPSDGGAEGTLHAAGPDLRGVRDDRGESPTAKSALAPAEPSAAGAVTTAGDFDAVAAAVAAGEAVPAPAERDDAAGPEPFGPTALPGIALADAAMPLHAEGDALPQGWAEATGTDGLSVAELRARGFDPAERMLERIQDEIDTQLLPIFLDEAAELVPLLGQQLRQWAGGELGQAQPLQRTLHTLKGSARMAGAMAIGQVAHSMETRVDNALALKALPGAVVDGLLWSYDRISALVDGLRAGSAGSGEVGDAAGALVAAAPSEVADVAIVTGAAAAAASPQPEASAPLRLAHPPPEPASAGGVDDAQRLTLRVRADLVDRLVNEAGEVAIARSRIEGELRALKSGLRELTDSVARLRHQLREVEIAAESQMQSRLREAEERHEAFDPLEFDRFTRFQEVARMMAESVNDVATVQQSLLKGVDDADLAVLAQARLNRDLQGNLMRVRMVPFNNVAERLYRVVRQTAKELGKRANLDIHGVQTEIDRSVLDRMTGPLEHLLRNAIAHGIEEAAARASLGKTEIGQIKLTARQEGNEFVLVCEDDGGGLDIGRIRARAVAAGLARPDEALADARIAEFIFTPGFSTAETVSAIAGRGVGMDVVRAEVAALGGRVDVDSAAGRGTRFTIALPLTLAVTQVVMVEAGAQAYAIPSVMVEQVRQMRADELEACHQARVVRWQDREYPLYYLPRLLGDDAVPARAQRLTPVLLMRSGTQRAAVHVDALAGNQEVVVKNIGPQLARVTGVAGATVLGDGRIVLILNPVPLAVQAEAEGARHSGPAGELAAADGTHEPLAPLVMVVDDSLTVRKITSRLLLRENYRVVTARDGVDALEQLQEVRPDILLVDIEMPRMDGFDLVRNVRADAALAKTPVIMITSRTAEKHRKYAMEVGVNMFLGKPYQEEALLDGIATLVRRAEISA